MMRLPRAGLLVALAVLLAACASDPPRPDDASLVRGWDIYVQKRCSSCHRIGAQGGTVGPQLSHVGTVAETRQAGTSADDYLRESVRDPGAYIVPGYPDSMPRGLVRDLSAEDLEALVRYLRSLR